MRPSPKSAAHSTSSSPRSRALLDRGESDAAGVELGKLNSNLVRSWPATCRVCAGQGRRARGHQQRLDRAGQASRYPDRRARCRAEGQFDRRSAFAEPVFFPGTTPRGNETRRFKTCHAEVKLDRYLSGHDWLVIPNPQSLRLQHGLDSSWLYQSFARPHRTPHGSRRYASCQMLRTACRTIRPPAAPTSCLPSAFPMESRGPSLQITSLRATYTKLTPNLANMRARVANSHRF